MAKGQNLLSSSVMDEKEKGQKKGTGAAAAGGGAAGGAAAGSIAGPIGSLIGAGVGAGASLVESNQAAKDTGPRPKRRKLTKALDIVKGAREKRAGGLVALSQAVSDFAANVR